VVEEGGTVTEEVIQAKTDYDHGTVVRLTALPYTGWDFVEWSGDAEGTESTLDVTVTSEMTITATFERKSYPLTIIIEGEGTVIETVVQKKTDYDYGTVVYLEASPDEGWAFTNWSGDATGSNSAVAVLVDTARTVTATFEQLAWTQQIDTVFFDFPEYKNQTGAWMGEFDRAIYYVKDGVENLVGGGVDWWDPNRQEGPLFHFYKPNGRWEFLKLYEIETSEFRNYEYFADGTGFLTCDHGPEWRVPDNADWPLGHMFVGIMGANNVEWHQVSEVRNFYHDCSYGDLNQDGIGDVVGGHFGNRIEGLEDNPHVYFGQPGYKYDVQFNILELENQDLACCHDVEIFDIDNDGINELIRIEFNNEFWWYDTYQFNLETSVFEHEETHKVNYQPAQDPPTYDFNDLVKGDFPNSDTKRYTKKRLHDFNNDGNWDFSTHIPEIDYQVVVMSTPDGYDIQTLSKQGNIDASGAGLSIKDFDVFDLENDGDPDVLLRSYYNLNGGVMDLSRVIFINDNGVMKSLETDKLIISGPDTPRHAIPFVKDNLLHFHGHIDEIQIDGVNHTRISTIRTSIPASNWYEE
jgi:hypothetical protein